MAGRQIAGTAADKHTDSLDPLEFWLAQERARGLEDEAHLLAGPEPELYPDSLPSGWWILPALALSLPLWAIILRMIFGG